MHKIIEDILKIRKYGKTSDYDNIAVILKELKSYTILNSVEEISFYMYKLGEINGKQKERNKKRNKPSV